MIILKYHFVLIINVEKSIEVAYPQDLNYGNTKHHFYCILN